MENDYGPTIDDPVYERPPSGRGPATWDDARDRVRKFYQQYLGRDNPSDDEIRSHLSNGRDFSEGTLYRAQQTIANSPEAQEYARRQASAPTSTPPGTPPGTPASAPSTPTERTWLDDARRFGGSGYQFTGFNLERDQDIGKSAKDTMAYAARQAEQKGAGDLWKTHAGAQQFAEVYLKPIFEQQGFKVLEIIGDKMRIVTREDEQAGNTAGSWIDFVVNAGGDSMGLTPMLAWQLQSGTGQSMGSIAQPPPAQPTAPTPTPTPAPTHPAPAPPNAGITPDAYTPLAQPASQDPVMSLAQLLNL